MNVKKKSVSTLYTMPSYGYFGRMTPVHRLSVSGMMLALGIILPFVCAHGIGVSGNVILPMHIPVLLCGMICGPLWGMGVGLVLPILNSLLTAMPPLYPMVPIMTCELAVYGAISGLLLNHTPLKRKAYGVYPALISAMVCGRLAYGAVLQILLLSNTKLKVLGVWMATVTGLPGIIIQLLLVPTLIFALRGFMRRYDYNAIESAKNLISREKATCVVIKKGKIVNIEYGRGIKPILSMYEQDMLRDSVVVDKVIGKASAMLMILGGVKYCYGHTVSESALRVLKKHGVEAEWQECVEYIINRAGDGMCPMENAVRDIEDVEQVPSIVKAKLEEIASISS